MRFTFTGKNVVVSDSLKEKCTTKIGRLKKLLPENAEVNVTFCVTKQENRVEVTIPVHRRILRAEVSADDMYTAVDLVVDILDKQMVKYKKRINDKSRRDTSFRDEAVALPEPEDFDTPADAAIRIEKTKRFALKPMDAEEAVMEMEMLGHNFFVFSNSQTDEVNVVYKRNNGSYGLIEPEY